MILVAEVDGASAQLVGAYAQLEHLAVLVRSDGACLRLICPAGCDAQLARLLYQAADEMAERAMPRPLH